MEAEEDHDLRSVAEIARLLKQIGDQLDNDPAYTRIISSVASASLVGGQYTILTNLIREFVMLVARSTNVSANLVKRIIRIFLSMWNDKELSRQLLQELNLETPSDVPDSSTVEDLPQEVQGMDDDFVRQYRNALRFGTESVKSVRLMVVGMFEVGKTSLVENLVETAKNHENDITQEKKVESTVGINVRYCTVKDDEWTEDIFDLDQKLIEVINRTEVNIPDIPDIPVDVVDDGSKENEVNVEIVYDREALQNKQPEQNAQSNNEEISHGDDENLPEFKEKLLNTDQHASAFIRKLERDYQDPTKTRTSLPMVSVWDFAGQCIYYSTHHFFLNSRSIYLLLMDVSKPLESKVNEKSNFPMSGFLHTDFTRLEAFKFWLNSIHMYSSQKALERDIKPTVILVGTHKDRLTGSDEMKEKEKEDYFNNALYSFNGTQIKAHVYHKKFLINNLDSKEDFGRIRKEVRNLAQEQKYWGEPRPAKWITLEKTFLRFKSEGKEIITFKDVREADRKNEFCIESEPELRAFLQFQHSVGNIIYYETDLLKDLVILSPQWIIDAFRCFVTHVPDRKAKQSELWYDYEKKAILTPELIDEIIDNTSFKDYKKVVIKYMEYLDMIARPFHGNSYSADKEVSRVQHMQITLSEEQKMNVSRADSETLSHVNISTSTCSEPPVFYIVPCLLKCRPPRCQISRLINRSCTRNTPILCMKFRDGFMPPSVFHRLLAICIRKFQLVSESNDALLYNGLAVFHFDETKKTIFTIWFQDNIIYARVCFFGKEQYPQAQKIRQMIVQNLTEILKILPNESRINAILPFEEYIQCPKVIGFEPGIGLMRMKEFLYENTLMCDYHELHPVNKDEAIGSWCSESLAAQKQQNIAISDTKLKEQLTEKELGRIAMGIGEKYYELGLELKLLRVRLDQIRDDERFHLPTRIYHMLHACKIDSGLTVEFLRNAMIVVELNIEAFDNVFKDSYVQRKQLRNDLGIDFNRKPSFKELSSLAARIGCEYWLLGVELGIQVPTMDHLRMEHPFLATRVHNMLIEWCKRDVNLEELGKAILLVGADIEAFYKIFSLMKTDGLRL